MGITASPRFIRLGAFLLGLVLAIPLAAEPRLVQDFRTGLVDEAAWSMTSLGTHSGVTYFRQSDPAHGLEIWRTDGTPDGTWRLTDVCPGPCSSFPADLVALGGRLVFRAYDGVSGSELWSSDGTPDAEQPLRDTCPGPCSGEAVPSLAGNRLYFTAQIGQAAWLWRSDGTPGGTVRVHKICESCTASRLTRLGGFFLFQVSASNDWSIWRTDGTAAGTRQIRRTPSAGSAGTGVIPAGAFAFFWTPDALWRTDGTPAGTVQLDRKFCGSRVDENVVWKGALYALSNGCLIRSDGTTSGTDLIEDFYDSESIRNLTPLGDWLVFLAGDEGSLYGVWRTQGEPYTAQELVIPPQDEFLVEMVPWGEGRAVFPVRPPGGPWQLWETDGTPQGTRVLDSFSLGRYVPADLLPAGDRLYLRSIDEGAILRLDDPETGPVPLYDLRTEASSGPLAQTILGGKLVFSARTDHVHAPLFLTDGTAAGTLRLSDTADWAAAFIRQGDRVFFTARAAHPYDSGSSVERNSLWTTDGTPGGTRQAGSGIHGFRVSGLLGNQLLFAADRERSAGGYLDLELWRSSGTRRGTRLVKNINRFQTQVDWGDDYFTCVGHPSEPGPGVAVGGRLLFAADDGRAGRELWSSDGTPNGTRLLLDINPRTIPAPPLSSVQCPSPELDRLGRGSDPEHLVAFRGGALFAAYEGAAGRELWWTDGTPAGTKRVKDLRPGPVDSDPHGLTLFGGTVYFFATTGAGGEGLWRTDGTAAGTFLVQSLTHGGQPSWGRSLTVVGNRLFFVVHNETTGPELWTSRGTGATTRLIADLRPGPAGAYPQHLTDLGGRLVFAADDGETGLEPWTSDGTAAGTRRLGDLWPGREPSAPGPFSRVGNLVLTGADDGEHGRELWAIPLP